MTDKTVVISTSNKPIKLIIENGCETEDKVETHMNIADFISHIFYCACGERRTDID